MRVITFAAGLAAGYVLGTRAGREKFDQIAATARRVGSSPTVEKAQEKAKELITSGVAAARPQTPAEPTPAALASGILTPDSAPVPAPPATPRPTRRRAATPGLTNNIDL